MKKYLLHCIVFVLLGLGDLVAQAPEGFVHLGRLYGASGSRPTDEFKADQSIQFPLDLKVDRTYRQREGVFAEKRDTNLAVSDIPPGFHIICHGTTSGTKGWAVLKPYHQGGILGLVADTSTGDPVGKTFTLGLYADTGHNPFGGGANVVVEVYYKPAPSGSHR